ncbi:MAG: ATP-binding protein [Planctomycetes bacterium]|nr:ATP-binding protein [Planctomycetota bacterium]
MDIIHAVNDLHEARPRLLAEPLRRAARLTPVRVVTGARQSGKSTLVQQLGLPEKRTYLTLDDTALLEQAQHAPEALLSRGERLTLDEVQRAPELLLAVKRAVDRERRGGRFLLTGSANLLLHRRVSESLTGRAIYFTLWPMTRREQLGLGTAGLWQQLFEADFGAWVRILERSSAEPEPWQELAQRGGFPTAALEMRDAPEDRALWMGGYISTYLERDLRELSAVSSLADFRRLMRAGALRLGQILNTAELGRDTGMPQATAYRNIGLLEASYLALRLPSFSVNRTKRLIKSPKLYWCDTGMALHLGGQPEPTGAHLENLVLLDLLAWAGSIPDGPQVSYWRTASGEEVDFVVEWKGKLLPIEVKSTAQPRVGDARALASFHAEYGKSALPGLLLHGGKETFRLTDGVLAAPWWRVL